MLPTFLITFRESLEASLIISVIFGYLIKTGRGNYSSTVLRGVAAGMGASVVAALLFSRFIGGLEGFAETLFEGSMMLFASLLISTLLMWAMKNSNIFHRIRNDVDVSLNKRQEAGLFLLSFIAVFREGVETVLFLAAVNFSSGVSFVGASVGFLAAIMIGYAFFISTGKLNIKSFFQVTGFLLLLFAAGLFAHSVHEFQEAGLLPFFAQQAWNTEQILSDKGFVGSIMKSLLGYNAAPSVLEVVAYFSYIGIVSLVYYRVHAAKNTAMLVKRV